MWVDRSVTPCSIRESIDATGKSDRTYLDRAKSALRRLGIVGPPILLP